VTLSSGLIEVPRGYCGIGIFHSKTPVNVGTLWRSAALFGADFLFTIGRRYNHQASDTLKAWKHTPLWNFESLDDFRLPHSCELIGVELDDRAKPLHRFNHPERAVYLLGAEDHGLSPQAIERCHRLVRLPGTHSMNVAVAGSIVLNSRAEQQLRAADSRPLAVAA
jgi:tRNA G18 (ribose-2'-O)-methylase SpoU